MGKRCVCGYALNFLEGRKTKVRTTEIGDYVAEIIDVKGAVVNITASKTVKFDKMMGSTGSAGGSGKSAKFSDKGEFKNLGKFVVLVGQSLKKMNVNLLQTRKEITGLRKENIEKLSAIADAIGGQRTELKSFAKSQKKANTTLKDLAGKVGTSLELDKVRNRGLETDRKEERKERSERRREARESALERGRKVVGGLASGAGKLAKGGKNFLKTIMDLLGVGGFIASVATAFAGYNLLKKALNSNFVKNVVGGFMEGMQNLIAGIQAIPEGAFDKIGKALGSIAKFLGTAFGETIKNIGNFIDGIPEGTLDKFGKFFGNIFKFVSAFVGDRFKDIFNGLDKVIDKDGNLKFDLGGIAQLITGVGGLALAFRYIKDPTKVIGDVGSILGFFGTLAGKAGAMPGPLGKVFSIFAERGASPLKPMWVRVVGKGGGLGGGLDDILPKGPGLKIPRKFTAPRGSGLNTGGSKLSKLMQVGKGAGVLARPGSIINASTGRATRMLGGNKAIDVVKNLKGADATKFLRKAVMSGTLSETQALKIAKSKGPNALKNLKGLLAQGGNLGRGLADKGGNALLNARQGFGNFMSGLGQKGKGLLQGAKGLGKNILAGALALPGNAANLAKGIGQKAASFGGSAVGGIKGSLASLGEGLANLNPAKALEKIKGGVGSKIDEIMKAEPLINAIKTVKDPKKLKEVAKSTLSRAKPALKGIKDAKKAMGPFKIPGLDAAIGALSAAIEIFAFKQPAGNAMLGALGGVLGSAAGTAVGTPGGPPGMFIGAMAGATIGELAGRGIARALGSALPPEIAGFTGINGAPLFSTAGLSENPEEVEPEPVKKARGGQIFGGRPTGDSVPAYLERGEYVMNRKAVSAIGSSNLDAMNFGAFPRFQEGGRINFGATIAKKLMEDFQGMSSAAAAGIAGNMDHESAGFIPDIREGGPYGGGSNPWPKGSHKGYGWAQWTGSRHDDFVDRFIGSYGKRATNKDNYSMLAYEMKKPGAGFIGQTLDGYNAHTSPAAAAVDFRKTWERAGIAHDSKRVSAANKIAPLIGGAADVDWQASDPNNTANESKGPGSSGLSGLFGFMQEGGAVHPTLKKMNDGNIKKAVSAPGMCVTGSLNTMQNSGVANPAATGTDRGNNPRGAISQLMQAPFNWKSMGGAKTKLNSPYGKVTAGVHSKAQYKKLVESGKVPSGALVFQTRHSSWDGTSPGSSGYDMAIAQQGGKRLWNGQDMGMWVYGNTKKVVVLTPDGKQGDGSDVQLSGPDSSSPDISPSSPSPSAGYTSYMDQDQLIASGGITGQANISALTKGIMKISSDLKAGGGGNIFGNMPMSSGGGSPVTNPPQPAATPANPTGGTGLSLESSSTTNKITEQSITR